jgi:hypothetical protein
MFMLSDIGTIEAARIGIIDAIQLPRNGAIYA